VKTIFGRAERIGTPRAINASINVVASRKPSSNRDAIDSRRSFVCRTSGAATARQLATVSKASNIGSTARKGTNVDRSSTARSSHRNVLSVSPRAAWINAMSYAAT